MHVSPLLFWASLSRLCLKVPFVWGRFPHEKYSPCPALESAHPLAAAVLFLDLKSGSPAAGPFPEMKGALFSVFAAFDCREPSDDGSHKQRSCHKEGLKHRGNSGAV